jgi:hypothetical protein
MRYLLLKMTISNIFPVKSLYILYNHQQIQSFITKMVLVTLKVWIITWNNHQMIGNYIIYQNSSGWVLIISNNTFRNWSALKITFSSGKFVRLWVNQHPPTPLTHTNSQILFNILIVNKIPQSLIPINCIQSVDNVSTCIQGDIVQPHQPGKSSQLVGQLAMPKQSFSAQLCSYI